MAAKTPADRVGFRELANEQLRAHLIPAEVSSCAQRRVGGHEQEHLILVERLTPPTPRGWPVFATVAAGPGRVVELRSAEAIKRLVEASTGIGLLARSAVAQEIRAGRFVPLQVTDLALPMPYALFTRALTRPLPAVARFRSLLVERLRSVSKH
jgi:DNA-binding transcriptional LysR family regulator